MISYNDIYTIVRQEKYSEILQKLPKNFLDEVREYIKEKRKILEKKPEEFDEALNKLKKQFENVLILINELFSIRQKKIVNLALLAKISGVTKSDIENMLPEERELFEEILKKIKEVDAKIKNKLSKEKEIKKENILIRFIEDVPEFLDTEGNKLGPFKKGDIANLPKEIAQILFEDKKVIKIEEDKI